MSGWNLSVRYIKGVGQKRAEILQKVGIDNFFDLLYYFPRRYEDRNQIGKISQAAPGENITVRAEVLTAGQKKGYRGKSIFTVAVNDGTGILFATFFNQPYLQDIFKPGKEVVLFGRLEIYRGERQMVHPAFEITSGPESGPGETGRIVALYRVPEGLSQRSFHQIIWTALKKDGDYPKEVVPFSIRENLNLGNLRDALNNIHFPVSFVDLKKAREYLIFEEFFLLTAAMLKHRMQTALASSRKDVTSPRRGEGKDEGDSGDNFAGFLSQFQNLLPFSLSESQQTALDEIITDLRQQFPMQRLLTGEVGSGKTAVAAGAIFHAILSGGQAALLAPTEILAEQHFLIFQRIFARAGYEVALLVSAVAKKDKERIKKEVAAGKISLVIGTHSLLSEKLNFTALSLAVIDEEHKFGVNQRELLGEKGRGVHVLLMSATPIPRTLALTLYGGLSLSNISERGQRKVATYLFTKNEREVAYHLFDTLLRQGKTGYIVTSRLKKSEDLVGARPLFEEISGRFPHWNPALIYGGLPLPEKERVIDGFRGGEYKVLVATSVVEVGLDLPEANLLMVEDAERFGLSQLHQMRGRIGRKFQDALCLVIGDSESGIGGERLNIFASIDQGEQLAEDDLILRGEGEVLGERQHGLPPLRIANLRRDLALLQVARDSAREILSKDPSLTSHPELSLRLRMQDIRKNK
ncbi:MAG: ATP-dependent DNA helicase RecG [Candidatus Ratteibacteria bacterium]|jgi:ATP-dependent DNA helicase RecG